MFISGIKDKAIAHVRIKESCIYCRESGVVNVYVLQRYCHIFWIPFIPVGKKSKSVCSHCKHCLEGSELPEAYHFAFLKLKMETRSPIWPWIGLILFLSLIVYTIIALDNRKEENLGYIRDPKIGDVYEWRTPVSEYTISKIVRISHDTIDMQWSKLTTSKSTAIYKIKNLGEAAFSNDIRPILLKEIQLEFDKGDIINISR